MSRLKSSRVSFFHKLYTPLCWGYLATWVCGYLSQRQEDEDQPVSQVRFVAYERAFEAVEPGISLFDNYTTAV